MPNRFFDLITIEADGEETFRNQTNIKNFSNKNYINGTNNGWVIPMTWQGKTTFIQATTGNINNNCFIGKGNIATETETEFVSTSYNSSQFFNANFTNQSYTFSSNPYNSIILQECRVANHCPKNCNQDLVHKKIKSAFPIGELEVSVISNKEIALSLYSESKSNFGIIDHEGNISLDFKHSSSGSIVFWKVIPYGQYIYRFGTKDSNLFIEKSNINGTVMWTKVNTIFATFHDINIVNDAIYLYTTIGRYTKMDLDGNIVWTKKFDENFGYANTVTRNGIWHIPFVKNKILSMTKMDLDGNIIFNRSYKIEVDSIGTGLWFCVPNSDGGFTIKVPVIKPLQRFMLVIRFSSSGELNFASLISDDFYNNGNFLENDGYTIVFHKRLQVSLFTVLDNVGNLVYCKKIGGIINNEALFNNIEIYKNGWILPCIGSVDSYILYLFPNSADDCLLENYDNITVEKVNLEEVTNTNVTNSFTTPYQFIDAQLPELENGVFIIEKKCTVNAPCIEICDNSIDDDDNGLTDCADTACPCNVCENKANISIQSIDQIQCEGDTYVVNVTVCNIGEKTINPNTPITFYNNDPWITNAQPISSSQYFINAIDIDSCVTQEFVLQKFTQGKIYAVVNATMDLATPFTSQTVFPSEDCDMTNNTGSFAYNPSSSVLELGPDVEICNGQSVLLSAQEGFEQYRWQDFYPDRNYTAINSGKYSITVTDACGVTQTDDITIKLKPLVAIDLGGDKTICKGDTITVGLNTTDGRDYLWDDGLPGIERSVNKAGVYTLGAYSDDICVVKDTITVTEVDRPVLDIANQNTLCQGDTFTISLPIVPGISYLWNDNNTSSERTFFQQGIFTVTTSNDYCSVTDSLEIEVTEKPIISLASEIKKCAGDSIMIGVNPLPGLMYTWNTGQFGSEIIVSESGMFTLTASENGCDNMASIEVIDISKPIIQLGDDINACEGDTITLSVPAQPNFTFLWNNGKINPAIIVNESGNFILEVKNENCISIDSINVTFLPLPISTLQDTVSACQGQMVTLSIDKTPQNKAVKWSNGATDFTIEVTQTGMYEVEISNEQCIVNDSVHVAIFPLPENIDLGGDTTICEGEVYNVPLSALSDHKYLWDDGNANPSRMLTKDGQYKLLVTNKYGCSQSDSITLRVTEMPDFDLGVDQKICLGDSILLNPDIPFGATIMWDNISLDDTRIIDQQGVYSAILTYDACQIKDSISIISEDCNPFDIHFPNVFRYNSTENGIFKPLINGDTQSITNYRLLIFDRWGNVVFKSSGPEDGWDGTFSGQPSETGVYIYTLNVFYSHQDQAKQIQKQGSVTLLK